MRRLWLTGIACVIAGLTSMLLALVHPFGDAHLYSARTVEGGGFEHSTIPAPARGILEAKCADCHSLATRPPIYGRLAPASWLMERDIVEARGAMNLDAWENYSADQQQTLEAKILQQIKANAMPPLQYRIIHWNARLTDADQRTLTAWVRGTAAAGESNNGSAADGSGPGDPLRGKELFEKRCTGCHAMEQNREGPQLRGVVGRTSGGVAGYDYSPQLKQAHIRWDTATLDRWLADPDTLVPGNNMEFSVSDAQQRRDLIRFLAQPAGQ
jgi:cytochrome c